MSSARASRECCRVPGCAGARLQGDHCLEHVTAQELGVAIDRLRAGEALDARNTTITDERLQALLDGLETGDRPVLPSVDFREATFSGRAVVAGVTFGQRADFAGATSRDRAGGGNRSH